MYLSHTRGFKLSSCSVYASLSFRPGFGQFCRCFERDRRFRSVFHILSVSHSRKLRDSARCFRRRPPCGAPRGRVTTLSPFSPAPGCPVTWPASPPSFPSTPGQGLGGSESQAAPVSLGSRGRRPRGAQARPCQARGLRARSCFIAILSCGGSGPPSEPRPTPATAPVGALARAPLFVGGPRRLGEIQSRLTRRRGAPTPLGSWHLHLRSAPSMHVLL